MDDKNQTGVCLTSKYDKRAAQRVAVEMGESAADFNSRMATRMQEYDSESSCLADDEADIETVDLDSSMSSSVIIHDDVADNISDSVRTQDTVVVQPSVSDITTQGHSNSAFVSIEDMYDFPVAQAPLSVNISTVTTQQPQDGCMQVCGHNLYMWCCWPCYRSSMNRKIKHEYGVHDNRTCFQRCCICYEFSRKCALLYNDCISCLSLIRNIRGYCGDTCHRTCREVNIFHCLFSLCLERHDRINIDTTVFIGARIVHDAKEMHKMRYRTQDYVFSDLSAFQWYSHLYSARCGIQCSGLTDTYATVLLSEHVRRRLQNAENYATDILRIILGNTSHPHIIRLLCGHLDDSGALTIATMISLIPQQCSLDVFLITNVSSSTLLDNEWHKCMYDNNSVTQHYCMHWLTLFSSLVNTLHANLLATTSYYTLSIPGRVSELMTFISARKYVFINKHIEDMQMLPAQGCYVVTCDAVHTLTKILLSQKVHCLETVKNPVVVFNALKPATTSTSLEHFMRNYINAVYQLLQHRYHDTNAYICRIHKVKLSKPLCVGHVFEKDFGMKVVFPYVGSEYCIIVNEYIIQDLVMESRLKVLSTVSAKAKSIYELKHPMFMLLAANQDLMHAFLNVIKYVILDSDITLLLSRLILFVSQHEQKEAVLEDFHYGNCMLINLMHADLMSKELQTVCTLLTEQAPSESHRNFCIPVTRLFHIQSHSLAQYGGRRDAFTATQHIGDLLQACKYTALSQYVV